jgi:hypothetical protein
LTGAFDGRLGFQRVRPTFHGSEEFISALLPTLPDRLLGVVEMKAFADLNASNLRVALDLLALDLELSEGVEPFILDNVPRPRPLRFKHFAEFTSRQERFVLCGVVLHKEAHFCALVHAFTWRTYDDRCHVGPPDHCFVRELFAGVRDDYAIVQLFHEHVLDVTVESALYGIDMNSSHDSLPDLGSVCTGRDVHHLVYPWWLSFEGWEVTYLR